MTTYYPLCVNLENRKCLVVGAGSIALRKINNLIEAKADVTVISRAAHPGVLELAENGSIKLITRPFHKEDLKDGWHLVIAATNNEKLHAMIYAEAEKRHILCNTVDDINFCNFIVPSIVSRGDLSISISTNGHTPFLSRAIKAYIEEHFGAEWGQLVTFGRILRQRNKDGLASRDERMIFIDFWASPLGLQFRSGDREAALAYIANYIVEYGA